MKKHLAIICGVFYPNPSATGKSAKQFAELLSDEYDIDVICLSEDEIFAYVDDGKGLRIHKLSGRRKSIQARSRGIAKKLIHMFGGIQIKTMFLGNLAWYRYAAYKKLVEIHSEHPFDVIFTVCSPFAAHCAGMDFKNAYPSVRWCGYTVDPYATKNRIRPFWCSYESLIEIERKTLLSMDSVLLSEEVYKTRPELYQECYNCRQLPYMMPKYYEKATVREFFDENDINCVFAGSFYRDIRNPKYMLDLFSRLGNSKIKLHLFSRGCEDIVQKYTKSAPGIVVHSQVTASEIAQVYRDSDILVNIGNSMEEFMPSKIFEYIATGKPIVSFYKGNIDSEVLGKYPLCLQIGNVESDDSVTALKEFIMTNAKKSVPPEEIRKVFERYSSENISLILHDMMIHED